MLTEYRLWKREFNFRLFYPLNLNQVTNFYTYSNTEYRENHRNLSLIHFDISIGCRDITIQSFPNTLRKHWHRLWMVPRPSDLHFFLGTVLHYVLPGIATAAASEIWGRSVRARNKDGNSKRAKINFFFARWYLGKWKSYRDNWKRVLKDRIPSF